MTEETTAPFYNDLDASLDHGLRMLGRGAKDRRAASHTFTVVTNGLDGTPQPRIVVNRGYDRAARSLRFHTDARSPKLVEIRADPRAAVHVYDARAKIQLRMQVHATLHSQDALHREAWGATRDFSRICYRVVPAPGDVLEKPTALRFSEGQTPDEGVENFVAVTLTLRSLEWLYLAHQGHRRARFVWNDDGHITQSWLVP
jgi:hypothetical protein